MNKNFNCQYHVTYISRSVWHVIYTLFLKIMFYYTLMLCYFYNDDLKM